MRKIFASIKDKTAAAHDRVTSLFHDREGDLAVNTIGGIIIGVVFVGLLIAAINTFFPGFFTSMFQSMSSKLNAHW